MIRPVNFRYNTETAGNNYYQKKIKGLSPDVAQERALEEFDNIVEKIMDQDVNVQVIEDTPIPDTPDAIFPNNWISFHQNGAVCTYPMFAENRREERDLGIVQLLSESYEVNELVDFTEEEIKGKYLEGTGSMLLDRTNKIVYATISARTNPELLQQFAEKFGYKVVSFTANQTIDGQRKAIYHTNVMMCLGEQFSVICLDSIDDPEEKAAIIQSLQYSGKEIIEITEDQVTSFAGNMLQVRNDKGVPLMIMSSAAYLSLSEKQRTTLEKYGPIVHSSLDTIEACGGGSARCMMAENFLPEKK